MDRFKESGEKSRKPYRKPSAKKVPLRPEEAVLGNCKNTNTGGANIGSGICSIPSNCSTIGS